MLAADNFTGEAMRWLRSFVLITIAVVTLGSTACRTTGLAFRIDERVEIISPKDRSTVILPFDLRWTAEDFSVVGADGSSSDDAGYFAVLIDTTPMPPSENPAYYARDDDSCLASQGCPDVTYLAERNVYLTKETIFPVTALTDTRPIDRQSAPDDHEISIVLLNGRSERIGEAVFRVNFTVEREQA